MPRGRGQRGIALAVSAVLHGAVLAGAWVAAGSAEPATPMRVFRVDIVSPPPNLAGEPPAEPPSAPPAAAPTAEVAVPEPAVAEPAPRPTPEPTAPPEPVPAPPKPQPAQPKPAPARAEPAKPKPAEPKKTASRPSAEKNSEGAAGDGRKAVAATGPDPVANSPGGEGLNLKTPGAACPSQEYCNNITRQVKRYFRRPEEARSARADVCFRVTRGGAVTDIEVARLRGSVAFKLALIEAVEQAGLRKEFGAIPAEFGSEWLDVCVEVSPAN